MNRGMNYIKEDELISVIVPVYNVEPYLRRCLDSIIGQTYKNIEIILVNDGSTDNSGEICHEYAKWDSRVTVYSQTNEGQGAARNFGVPRAKGKYIAFIDSDDVIEKNYIEQLYFILKGHNADIACCGLKTFVCEREIFCGIDNEKKIKEYTDKEALDVLLYQRELINAPWCKLINIEIVKKYPFPEQTGYEDMAVVYKWFAHARKIVYVQSKLYYYRQVKNSTMHQPFHEKKLDRIRIAEDMRRYLGDRYPELYQAIQARFFLANIQTLMWLPFGNEYKKEFLRIKENIKEVRYIVLCDKKAKRGHRIMAFISYVGIRNLMFLGRIYRVLII